MTMKRIYFDIIGGAKVHTGTKRFKVPKLIGLLAVLLLLYTSSAFAQGSIFGAVHNSNATVPANGEISFYGFLDNTDEEIRLESSVGAGYDGGFWFDDFQNYLTKAPGNPYRYYFHNTANNEGALLSKLQPNNSFQQEDVVLAPVTWPVPPTAMAGRAVSGTSVVVSWLRTAGLTYHVYRRLATSGGSFFRIDNPAGSLTNPGVADSFFVDNTTDGVSSYHYLLIAQDASGNLGPHSAILTVDAAAILPPTVTSIVPNSGTNLGGTLVTINGSGFDMLGATARVGTGNLTTVVVVSPYQLTGHTAAGTVGLADVVVTNTASAMSSNVLTGAYTYLGNQPPVLAAIGAKTVAENANLNFNVSATDPDGTTPILTTTALPTGATFVDHANGTGTFNWTPTFAQSGSYPVTFYARDGIATDSEVVTITVTEVDRPPVLATIGPRSVNEGVNLNFADTATDPDGTIPTLTTSTLPTGATFVNNLNGTGTFNWTPTFFQAGVYNISFYASDGTLADTEIVTITVNNVNREPVLAAIGPKSVNENVNLNFGVSATDPDSTIPTMTTTALPTGATFTDNLNGTGTFNWTPTFLQSGIYNVTFYASDGTLKDSEIVTITVNNVDQPPVLATIGPKSTAENVNLNFNTSATDPDGTIPTLTTTPLPTGATYVDHANGTGTFNWTPTSSQSGVYPVTFYASDGSITDSEVVTITVGNVNLPPVLAAIGAKSVNEGVILTFGTSASDPDGTIPSLTTSTLPTGATYTDNLNGTGTFNWTPTFFQSGVYNISFFASDGTLADTEIVTITVNNVNREPVLAAIGPKSVNENVNLNFGVSATDPDSTIPVLTTTTLPTGAVFTDNLNGTGTFNWTPSFSQSGIYNITFYASDGTLKDSEIVTVTVNNVNQPPVLAAIGPKSTSENVNLNFNASATDPDGTIPALTTTALPTGATFVDHANGTGTFNWTPTSAQSGIYPVTFYASDGSITDSEVVTISVGNVNLPPVLAAIGAKNVNEGVNLNFADTATDPDGTIPTLTTSALPTGATFTDNLNGTGTFNWTPTFFQAAVYNISFIASDGALADTEVVTITVNNVNREPVLTTIGPKSVDENVNLNFGVSATDPDSTIPTLTTSALPTGATFVNNLNGTGTFNWTPTFAEAGSYNVTFYASDGTLKDSEIVTITVNNVNQPPVLATIGPKTVTENVNLNFTVSATDADGNIPGLTTSTLPTGATFVDHTDGTATFNWTPNFSQSGSYPVTFYAGDGVALDSEVVTITVTEVGNQPPVLDSIGPKTVAEAGNLTFRIHATDLDGTLPSLSASGVPANAIFTDSLNGSGSFIFNPDLTQSGSYSVVFKAFDGVAVDSEVVVITVTNVNQPPVLAAIGARSTTEGVNLTFGVTATDGDAQPLTLTTSTLPTGATFVDNGGGSGTFNWTPGYAQAGTYPVTFRASDGIDVDSEVVTITVIDAGNQAPVLDSIRAQVIAEGQILIKNVHSTDADGTIPTLTTGTLPLNATFFDSANGNGVFRFAPDFTQSGSYSVLFITSDGTLADSELVSISVTELGNQPPVFVHLNDTTISEGDSIRLTVSATDPEGLPVRLSVSTLLSGYNFVDSGNGVGVFRYLSNVMSAGIDSIRFIATDFGTPAMTSSDTVVLTIREVNQPPIIDSLGPFGAKVGKALTFRVHASDTTDPITFHRLFLSASNLPANAYFVDSGNNAGSFTFTPTLAQVGVLSVTFQATDMGTPPLSAQRQVGITVVAENNPPTFVAGYPPQYGMVREGGTLQMVVKAIDIDGQIPVLGTVKAPLHSTFVDSGNGTGLFTFTPSYVQAGLVQVVFSAYDGIDMTRSWPVVIQVAEAGDQAPIIAPIPPQTVTEGGTLSVQILASDPDETVPVLTADSLPTGATFTDNHNGTGTFDFNPTYVQSGSYNVYLIASDGTLADTVIIPVTVIEAGNQRPALKPITSPQVTTEMRTLNFQVTATDPDMNIVYLTAANLPAGASFTDHHNDTAVFNWATTNTDSGHYTVTFYATDSLDVGLRDSSIISIVVNDTNLVPRFAIPNQVATVNEGATLTFRIYAIDPDGAPAPLIRMSDDPAYQLKANMTFNTVVHLDTTIGTLTFTPDYTQGGPPSPQFYYVAWKVMDARDTTLYLTTPPRQFTVNNADQPPSISPLRDTTITEGQTLQFSVIAADPDGPVDTLKAENLPPNSSFLGAFALFKTFRFTPDFTQSGAYTVRFICTDGIKADTELVTITVLNAGNQAPVFSPLLPDLQTIVVGQQFANHVKATDPEGGPLVITVDTVIAYATFTDSGNGAGSYIIMPNAIQVGLTYRVTFTVRESGGLTDTMVTNYRVAQFMRGDANSDNRLNASDVIFLINFLYKGGARPASMEAADANFDQGVNLGDAIYLVNYFYKQGPPPPPY